MSFPTIPASVNEINPREWASFEPFYKELQERPLTTANARQWLEDWSHLYRLFWESAALIYIEKSIDTTDEEKEQAFLDLINDVSPQVQVADQALKERLLALNIPDEGMPDMALVLRDMRNDADLFCEENIPLETELSKLDNQYDKITGGMQAEWDGEEQNLSQLSLHLTAKDRQIRQDVWECMANLWLGSREEINGIYSDMLKLRKQVAENAGVKDYREFSFRSKGRFEYTPDDCLTFHNAIETAVVPAVKRILAKKRARLGYDAIKPWDWIPERGVLVEASDAKPLKPYEGQDELIQHTLNIFNRLDSELSHHFATMAEENLLDLDTRAGKALGGYCSTLPLRKRPFIFMNGVGTHDNVQTMLHEAGHAFHVFESNKLPLIWQTNAPMEFCEVASMSMELLAAPYLTKEDGGFYSASEAARARIEHLEGIITFLPYMAVVDAFQHWVYTNIDEATDPHNCDTKWNELWERFIPEIDWAGYEDIRVTGWHRKPHIFGSPFYYIEYGMAQVGALQVWRNSLSNPEKALSDYRQALACGGTKTLPELFQAAGAEFRFDDAMLKDLVDLIENTIESLEAQL